MTTESLYSKAILSKPISIPFHLVGSNIRDVLQSKLSQTIEGKCIKEGYIRPNSVSVMTYSSGMCKQQNIIYQVTFSCVVCYPVEGMKIRIKIMNITKAGIRGASRDPYSPIDVFIARDHNVNNVAYQKASIDDELMVEIVGQRYEIHDKVISVIADIVDDQSVKLKLVREEEEEEEEEED